MKYSFTFLYIILTACSATIIHNVGLKVPGDLMIMLSAIYALFYFHLLNFKKIVPIYKKLLPHKKLYFWLVFLFMVVWVLSFVIPIYFTPALMILFAMAIPSCIGSFMRYQSTRLFGDKFAFVSMALLFIIVYICLSKIYPFAQYILLVLLSLTIGICTYLYIKLSYQMNQCGFSASQILAVRYWLLVLLPLLVVINNHHLQMINAHVLLQTLLISFVGLIIPVYCAQISIEKIGPNIHSVLIGITPFIGFLIEIFFSHDIKGEILDGVFSTILACIIFVRYLINLKSLQT